MLKPNEQAMSITSGRAGENFQAYADNWEKIFGKKEKSEDVAKSDEARSEDSAAIVASPPQFTKCNCNCHEKAAVLAGRHCDSCR
jgi:hypothetical protein